MNKEIAKKTIFIILNIILSFIIIYSIIAFINFKKIENNKEPFLLKTNIVISTDSNKITKYDGVLYKIIKNEEIGIGEKIKLKLWFGSDD